jgi:hypothetical protein
MFDSDVRNAWSSKCATPAIPRLGSRRKLNRAAPPSFGGGFDSRAGQLNRGYADTGKKGLPRVVAEVGPGTHVSGF